MMIKLILAILEVMCHYPNELSPEGTGDSKLELVTKGNKAQYLAKALGIGSSEPPSNNQGWYGPKPSSMSVSIISVRDPHSTDVKRTLHMCPAHCSTDCGVAVFTDSHACVEEICKLIGGRLRAQVD